MCTEDEGKRAAGTALCPASNGNKMLLSLLLLGPGFRAEGQTSPKAEISRELLSLQIPINPPQLPAQSKQIFS